MKNVLLQMFRLVSVERSAQALIQQTFLIKVRVQTHITRERTTT